VQLVLLEALVGGVGNLSSATEAGRGDAFDCRWRGPLSLQLSELRLKSYFEIANFGFCEGRSWAWLSERRTMARRREAAALSHDDESAF
jgi:hypothetical protein